MEANAADRWIYGVLSGDATLTGIVSTRIYNSLAVDGAALPYVVFQMQAGVDLMTIGSTRVWSNMLYLVRGIDESLSYGGNLQTIADRIDAVLHAQSGSNVDGEVYMAVREQPFRLLEAQEGRQFRHSGGIYRILAV